MLLLFFEGVHTRNKSFPHRQSLSVAVYLIGHLAAALLEKKPSKLWIFPAVHGVILPHGDCIWGAGGGLIFAE